MDSKDRQIQELTELVTKLLVRIDSLENELSKYRTTKNSSNSSIPPSKDENRPKKPQSLRQASGKKTGGQQGHKGHTLKMSAHPNEVISYIPEFCNG